MSSKKLCKLCPCGKHPYFGFARGKKPSCCKNCKKDGMINIKSKKCSCGSGKRPYFGFSKKRAICCFDCKEDGMIDLGNKKCLCGKHRPTFGFLEDKSASCCKDCKKNEMINIRSKKCPCGKSPTFGFPEDKKATCCKDCKEDEMININIRSKCPCGKQPYFGFPEDKKAICCKDCKENGMEDIRHKKCSCGKIPNFGFPQDRKATYCKDCKKNEMINIISKKCKANEHEIPCPTIGNPYYDYYCTHCFAHLFPDHLKTANIRKKSKELKVVNYISSRYEGFLHDKPLYVDLNGGCCPSRRRIDLRKLVGNTLFCIEIDEHQHRGYCQLDEENRYNDLFVDFSGKYIFIRYNPDKFKDDKGKRRNPKFETRMEALETEIEKNTLRIDREENKELLEIHHLFFDKI
jgi:hypothetical protein